MLRMALLSALICAVAQPARAQELTARQQEILKTAIAADGWLTESMHQEFWAAIPLAIRTDLKAVAALTTHLDRSSASALRFQRATWLSVKLTLAAKRVSKTLDYETAKEEMLRASSIPQERIAAEKGASNADAMLEAAATGRSFSGPRGPLYVTEEVTERVLAGLDGSFHRFRRLSNPAWIYKAEEHSYPNEHLRILWDGPFARETQTITIEGGKSIPITLLSSRLSERDHVAIGFMRLGGQWLDPEGASIRTVAANFKGMGIHNAQPTASCWRGRVAADGAGSARTADGAIYVALRIVEAREHAAAWQIMAVSGSSLADAISLRERLEQAIQVQGEPQQRPAQDKSSAEKKAARTTPDAAKLDPLVKLDEDLRKRLADIEFENRMRPHKEGRICGYGPNGVYKCTCPAGTAETGAVPGWGTCVKIPECPPGQRWGNIHCPFSLDSCGTGCTKDRSIATEDALPFWEEFELWVAYRRRDLSEAAAHPGIQALTSAFLLSLFALSGGWRMTQPRQALIIMILAGGGSYFLATAFGVPNLYIDRPWLVGVGVFMLLGAWFAYSGWFSRR